MAIITVPGADNSLLAVTKICLPLSSISTALPIPEWLIFRTEVVYWGYLPNKESEHKKGRGISKGLTDYTHTRGIQSMEIDARKTKSIKLIGIDWYRSIDEQKKHFIWVSMYLARKC